MKVGLVNLPYPYGKKVVYLNFSLFSVAAILMEMGHKAELVDLNIDEYEGYGQRVFNESDVIGISLLGAPAIPSAIEFVRRIQKDFPCKAIAVGGQVIENISRVGFAKLFGRDVKQIIGDQDFAEWIGEDVGNIPHFLDISYRQSLREMGNKKLQLYLDGKELPLIISDGCAFGVPTAPQENCADNDSEMWKLLRLS